MDDYQYKSNRKPKIKYMDEIIVNEGNYDHHLYLAEKYLNKELPVDKVEWYDRLIAAIELYEDSIWPAYNEDDEGGTI